jgi:hypothetical protein
MMLALLLARRNVPVTLLLAEPLKTGTIEVRHLAQVQRKRQWPTRVIQLFGALGMRAIARSLRTGSSQVMPRYLRWMFGLPLFGKLMARLVAFGFWRVRVEET